MRGTRIFGSLSALGSVATLLLVLPSALCQQGDSCEMRHDMRHSEADAPCMPGPSFDCCQEDQAPPTAGHQQVAKRLGPASTAPAPLAAVPARPADDRSLRIPDRGGTAPRIPLYTLLASLLI